jgi:hypothetical protein
MGLLKKIFKPVSKVLDKIIPNELKPILPYAAAFAPYAMPGIMGIGGNTMLSRALMSGGLNIGAQLAQEGSEGDINLLSAGLGALQGAMTAPGSLSRSMHPTEGVITSGQPGAAQILATKADAMQPGMMKSGLEALGKGSKYLTGAAETLQSNPFSVEGLKAAAIPFAQGTADVMYAQGNRDLKDLANDVVEDMGGGYTDDAYRAAIRKSMTAYGATEEEIIDAIEAAGYKSGGRVGFANAGLAAINPQQSMDKEETQWLSKVSPTREIDTINRIYEESGNEGLQAYLERNPDLKDKYVIVTDGMSGELTVMPNKIHEDFIDKEKIIMIGDGQGGIDISSMFEEKKAKGGRVGLRFGGIGEAVEQVDNTEMKETMKLAQDMDMPIADLVEEFMIIHKRKPNSLEELKMFYKDKYEYKGPADVKMQETMTERFTVKDGGRIGFSRGGDTMARRLRELIKKSNEETLSTEEKNEMEQLYIMLDYGPGEKDGGRINKNKGGMMSVLPKGIEADYRGGGFIPIGSKERADDVPARLSENEFVMTADAVRAAGGGSVNQGAKRMYNLMHNLEARA